MNSKLLNRVQKVLGLGNVSLSLEVVALSVLQHKNMKQPKEMTRPIARRIVSEYMRETGISYTNKLVKHNKSESFVYIIQQNGGYNHIKIGKSNDVDRRVSELKTASPYPLIVLAKICALNPSHALAMEKMFHKRLSKFKLAGEWFSNDAFAAIKHIAF